MTDREKTDSERLAKLRDCYCFIPKQVKPAYLRHLSSLRRELDRLREIEEAARDYVETRLLYGRRGKPVGLEQKMWRAYNRLEDLARADEQQEGSDRG